MSGIELNLQKQPTPLTRSDIAARIPHGEPMCMLDRVIAYSSDDIHCQSEQWASASHPLEAHEIIAPELLIEYAAQAAALHASLTQNNLGIMRPAYIGAIKNIELLDSISDNQTPLDIFAQCLLSSAQGAIYQIRVSQNGCDKLCGRLLLNQP